MQFIKSVLLALAALLATTVVAATEPAPAYVGIDHVELKVADPARSLAFYVRLFGADVLKPKQGGQRFLQLGDSFLAFTPDRATHVDHVAYSLRQYDAATLQDWLKREALVSEQINGGKALLVLDRDGNRSQLVPQQGWEALVASGAAKEAGNQQGLFHPQMIDEVSLMVTNMEVDSLFYARLLGKSGTLQAGSLWFTFGGARLRLGQAPVGQKPGTNYFSVLVSNTNLEMAADAVFKAGGIIENILPNGFSFWDPDGIRVEIHVAGQF